MLSPLTRKGVHVRAPKCPLFLINRSELPGAGLSCDGVPTDRVVWAGHRGWRYVYSFIILALQYNNKSNVWPLARG